MQRLGGRTVLVTGAGSGIGKASAVRIASEGGSVFCVDLNEDAVEATCLLYTSPSPRDLSTSRMPSSA